MAGRGNAYFRNPVIDIKPKAINKTGNLARFYYAAMHGWVDA